MISENFKAGLVSEIKRMVNEKEPRIYYQILKAVEIEVGKNLMEHTNNSVNAAAKESGLSSTTFREILNRHNLIKKQGLLVDSEHTSAMKTDVAALLNSLYK